MSDSAIATLVSGLITVATMVTGWLTLWIKIKYGADKTTLVEKKLDANTAITVDAKQAAATAAMQATVAVQKAVVGDQEKMEALEVIKKQTNGSADYMRQLLESLSQRVVKLEEYNHQSVHRLADGLNQLNLKVAEMAKVFELTANKQRADQILKETK